MRFLFFLTLSLFVSLAAQTQPPGQTISIEEYEPKSTLVVPAHPVTQAKFPFIDVHNHQFFSLTTDRVDTLVMEMDKINMAVMNNLSGGTGEGLKTMIAKLKRAYPKRFTVFADMRNYDGIDDPDFGKKMAARLEEDVKNGAQGLKIYKNLGLDAKDGKGKRIPVDDPRLDPLWEKAGELHIPVFIHSGEPASFFDPQDKYNERWLELKQFPNRARPPERYPSWEQVMSEQRHMFAKHPKTTFVAAHLAWLGGDLGRLGAMLDSLPNVYTEIGAVLAEIGRQPRFAREWFIKYQNRVLFGKDIWEPSEYHYYFRVLETADEYFDYYRKRHAFWKMYGLNLPDDVLKKLYYKNALRVIPGIDPRGFPN
ncbi:MAG: amidohydrolase family protein [Ignavibacteriales bacterium]|nr:amidohydrolase family protein [Ignavibacteriales bacterium]